MLYYITPEKQPQLDAVWAARGPTSDLLEIRHPLNFGLAFPPFDSKRCTNFTKVHLEGIATGLVGLHACMTREMLFNSPYF